MTTNLKVIIRGFDPNGEFFQRTLNHDVCFTSAKYLYAMIGKMSGRPHPKCMVMSLEDPELTWPLEVWSYVPAEQRLRSVNECIAEGRELQMTSSEILEGVCDILEGK